jgi:hypothetical protein
MDDVVPTGPPTPDSALPSVDPGGAPAPVPAPGDRGSARTWIIAAAVAVVVVVAVVVAVVLVEDSAAIHDGPGTVTFTWTPVSQGSSSTSATPPPQPFTAQINGHSVSGKATLVIDESAVASLFSGKVSSRPVPEYRYTGQFAGKPFSIVLAFQVEGSTPLTIGTASSARFRFTVHGTYDDMPITGVVTVPPQGPTNGHPAHLTGTIGHWHVSADIPNATGSSSQQSATVHFVVSG